MVAHQQQQPVRLVALGPVGEPNIATNQGFDAGSACRLVEFDQAEQIAKIGQRQRRHAVGLGRSHRIVDTHDAINDGELAVQAEVDERRLHNALFYGVAAPGLMHARRNVLGQ